MKRLVDILFSFLGLVMLLPIFAAVAVVVGLGSRGGVFHVSQRVGRGKKLFGLYKFRSMVAGAADLGPGITAKNDTRVTPAGRWLRRFKLDELPQLWNVLKGDMSLVGPRPEDPRYVAFYTAAQRRVLEVRPGITSPSSIRFRDEENLLKGEDWEEVYRQKVMPEKLQLDLEYIRDRSLWLDLTIIFKTLVRILK